MRIRRRALGLLLGAAVLFMIGTNAQAGWLYVLCALLLGAVLAGVLLPFAALRGLRAELVAPSEAEQGGETFVDVRLSNTARGVRWSVVVADRHLEAAEVFVPSVRPGERVELTTLRRPERRGEARTERIEVRSSAPFGVAERRRRLPVDATTLVLPRIVPLERMPFVDATATNDVGIHRSPRRGHGPEYLGVREYRTGDSMRHVHWGLTARHGQVMVREFEQERTRRLAVVVDTERDEGESWTPLDRCCCVAASLLEAASAHGHGARLAAAGAGGDVEVLARADEDTAMRWLARLTASATPFPEALGRLGVDELRGVETLLAVFPVWGDSDLRAVAAALGRLSAKRVVAIPLGVTSGEVDVHPLTEAGVEIHPWRVDEDLAVALEATT
jgi:uncharacterized protein (DUF58 family)